MHITNIYFVERQGEKWFLSDLWFVSKLNVSDQNCWKLTVTALSVSAQGGSHFVAFDCVASDDVAFDDVAFDIVAFCFYRDTVAGRLHQTPRGT